MRKKTQEITIGNSLIPIQARAKKKNILAVANVTQKIYEHRMARLREKKYPNLEEEEEKKNALPFHRNQNRKVDERVK